MKSVQNSFYLLGQLLDRTNRGGGGQHFRPAGMMTHWQMCVKDGSQSCTSGCAASHKKVLSPWRVSSGKALNVVILHRCLCGCTQACFLSPGLSNGTFERKSGWILCSLAAPLHNHGVSTQWRSVCLWSQRKTAVWRLLCWCNSYSSVVEKKQKRMSHLVLWRTTCGENSPHFYNSTS